MKKIAIFAFATLLASCGDKQQMPPASNDYAVVTIKPTEANLSTSYPATIKGMEDVEIRPRVSGNITRILVDEGDFVRAGQPLFEIDRVQYVEAVNQAQASVSVCEAAVNTQKLTAESKQTLYDKKIISKYDLDVAMNQLAQAKAQLSQAKAALSSARNNLSYCSVSSPATGVVGMLPYRVGSNVSSQNALTTVSNITNMYVYFSMTEKQLLSMTRESGGIEQAMKNMPAVRLNLADGTTYGKTGSITAIGGVIDQKTGAVQIRATFDNAEKLLRSGGTGAIVMPIHVKDAILVPQKATYEIQNKKFVYVVGKDKKVASREIEVMIQNNGESYVVTSGLNAGEQIVVEGVNQLKNGMEITPISLEQSEKNKAKARQDLKDGKMPGEK